MKTINLGNTGINVSQYVLGTMLMGSKVSKNDSFEVLDDFIKRGGNFIDTANNYAWWIGTGENSGDESQTIIGDWLEARNNREKVFLATKVGARQKDHMAIRDEKGIPYWDDIYNHLEGASSKVIRTGVKKCLEKLKTKYIDLLYIHVDDRNTDLVETIKELNDLIDDGLIKFYGYSNIQTWRLEQIFNICDQYNWKKPVAVQLEYSYINPSLYGERSILVHAMNDFFDWLESKRGEVSLIAYSPMLKGVYCDEQKRIELLKNPEYNSIETKNRINRILNIAKENALTPNGLVLSWLANRKEGIFPIMGFSKKEQYFENILITELNINQDILNSL